MQMRINKLMPVRQSIFEFFESADTLSRVKRINRQRMGGIHIAVRRCALSSALELFSRLLPPSNTE